MEQNKEKNFVSAVVYCCNDSERINNFIQGLDTALFTNFLKYEIIVVNDASDDNCFQLVKEYAHKVNEGAKEHTITLLNMSYRQGLEASMNAGTNLAIGDFVFEFDSISDDFDMNLIMDVYFHSLKGYDIVSAKSDKKGRWMSRKYYYIFNKYARLQHTIGTETFRIISRRAINRIHSITQIIPYRKAAYANSGLAMDSINYHPSKVIGKKRYDDSWKVAIESLLLYTDVPYRATILLALLMLVVSMTVGLYAVVFKLLSNPVEGWTTTIFFISFGFSGLFIILAMIIRYMQTLVRLSFRKKDYLFESIEKLQ